MPNYQIPNGRKAVSPKIYAFKSKNDVLHPGFIKIGYTERQVAERVHEISGQLHAELEVLGSWNAIRDDGTSFWDKDVHNVLSSRGFYALNGNSRTEWFRCSVKDVESAISALVAGTENELNRTLNFKMRPEQERAVAGTAKYFKKQKKSGAGTPKFLWNCKMRFGKTFAAYKLSQAMNFKRVLVLTFKPAVQSAWKEDLEKHVDFEGWQFICRDGLRYENADKNAPFVCFGSFQDFLGRDAETGGIKPKNEWIHEINWDLVIFDEYHFGAWREKARDLFASENEEEEFDAEKYQRKEAADAMDETFLPITTNHYLYLSGTPFRAINTGEFVEDQIFNWTYADEQDAKNSWKLEDGENPYAALPRMVMMTYRVPEEISHVASETGMDSFDLNEFFAAEKNARGNAVFKHKNEVQKWLDLVRGAYSPLTQEALRAGGKMPPLPFYDARLKSMLTHTLWFLPNVAACEAMAALLRERQNQAGYGDFEIICCAGTHVGNGVAALPPVIGAMNKNGKNPLETKTITLTCGKLTTGVTVRPWSGIFMLRNLKSAETYFQAAFRVQSPWTVVDENGEKQIVKEECYLFDFALDRALKQVADYSCQLNVGETNPEKKVSEFINFLPVLAFDGAKMVEINAREILDFVASGTTSSLLARRWESALLVNVKDDILKVLRANEAAMKALEKIEAFRNLRADLETIINKSEKLKSAKKEGGNGGNEPPKPKKELTKEEKEMKSLRKQIQEKLIKLATRIPIFMYLTDDREHSLKDVIRSVDKNLFTKVTGLTLADFDLLCSLKVFNSSIVDDAIYKFKRYEDASLEYMGINKHGDETRVGGFDSTISKKEYQMITQSREIVFENRENSYPC